MDKDSEGQEASQAVNRRLVEFVSPLLYLDPNVAKGKNPAK